MAEHPTDSPTPQARGYVIALIGTALWSSTAVFIRTLTERHMPPLVLAFWRDGMVALVLLAALIVVRPGLLRLPRRHVPFFFLYGLVLTAFNATWTISVALNGAAVATVLAYSSPAITALIGWWLWREALGPFKVVAVLLSLIGCVFVSGAYSAELWNLNPAGIVLGLVSGLMFAAYSLFGREASRRGLNPWVTLLITFALATVYFLILLQVPIAKWTPELAGIGNGRDLLWLGDDWVGWGILLALAWGPTIGGYGLYTVSLGYLPASVANLIASLEPAMTAGLAFIFLDERLTAVQLLGSGLIIGGVLLLRADSLSRRRALAVES